MGTKSRSPGWPFFDGAYSMIRYSRSPPLIVRRTISTYLPTPCCSCTTKSPALSVIGSIALRRRDGMRRAVLGDRAALAGEVGLGEEGDLQLRRHDAAAETAGRDVDDAGLDRGLADQPRGHLGRVEPLDRALRRTVPVEDQRDPPAVAHPALQIGQRRFGVAAVGRAPRRSRCARCVSSPSALMPHHGMPSRSASASTSSRSCSDAAAEVDRRLAAAGGRRPGRLEELLRWCGPDRRRGCGSAPGRRARRATRPAVHATRASVRRRAPGRATPCPRPPRRG